MIDRDDNRYPELREFQDEFAEFREQGFGDINAVFSEMEKVFADMGLRDDMRLDGMQRRLVQQALFSYVFDRPLRKDTLDQLRRLEKKLNETAKAIQPILDLQELIADDDARINLGEEQARLKLLSKACRKLLACPIYTRKRKPLIGVMESLEELFLELTDDDDINSANIKRRGKRESRFLDFMWAAFRYLPEPIRPGEEALASAWELHYLARNKTRI